MLNNIAVLKFGFADECDVTLLGKVPAGVPQVHKFHGHSFASIDRRMIDLGIHVVGWMVRKSDMPSFKSWAGTDLPIIEVGDLPVEVDDRFGNAAVLAKLKPGEPFFVLRGQDKLAPAAVRHWANEAEKQGIDPAKVQNARNCAHAMMQHRPIKMPD